MNEKLKIRRGFPHPDPVMLSAAEVNNEFFTERESDFTSFDLHAFPEGIAVSMKLDIDAAHRIARDSLVIDQLAEETAEVTEKANICIDLYDDLVYFVDKSFEDHPEIENQFCYNSFNELKHSNPKLVLCLEEVLMAVDNHYPELKEVGFTPEKRDLFSEAVSSFRHEYISQQEAIKRRPEKTHERILLLNRVWANAQQIWEAAKRIYRNQPEILSLFELPKVSYKSSGSQDEDDGDAVDVDVADVDSGEENGVDE